MKPLSVLVEYDKQDSRPYSYKMEKDQPVSAQHSFIVSVKATDIPSMHALYVDREEKLQEMIMELQTGENMIGVDVEHHSYRSYLGK